MAGALIRHVRDHVRYVVVDEYQDTNPIQEKLIERLCRFGANLCVVGDDDQTIYQWRGSAVSNILSFTERQEGVRTVTLDDNFRSSPGIVALGREVAARNDPDRLAKNMVAAGHQTYERGDMLALTFDSPTDEAAWICDRIERLRGVAVHRRPGGAAARAVLVGLRGAVPLGVQGRGRACRRAAAPVDPVRDQGADPAVRRTRGAGVRRPASSTCCTRSPRTTWWTRGSAPTSGVTSGRRWRRRCRSWRKRGTGSRASGGAPTTSSAPTCGSSRPSSIREETVRRSADGSRVRDRGELVFYNLGKFSQAISDFEQIYFQSDPQAKYDAFVKWLVYQAPDYYAESDADVGYATPDAVTIATVHQAKGMQWPAVFVPGAAEEPVPVQAAGRPERLPRDPARRRCRTRTGTGAPRRTRPGCSTSRSPGRRSTCT